MSTASMTQAAARGEPTIRPPGAMSGAALRRTGSHRGAPSRPARFVTQSHPLGAPPANPQSLLIAAAVAVALYLIGRRLSS